MSLRYEKKAGKEGAYIEITGCTDAPSRLRIPQRLEGLPVRSIGSRAFAGITGLKELLLPESVDTIRPFAFHQCTALEWLELTDAVTEYYDGAIRRCGALKEIRVDCPHGDFTVVRAMLSDSDRALCFHLTLAEGAVRLYFPAYVYDFVENTEARTIQFAIDGAGYGYRECVSRAEINFREYDRLFARTIGVDPAAAAEIAFDRLMYPHRLTAEAAAQYETFLRAHAEPVLLRCVEAQETARVAFLTERRLIGPDALPAALRLASERWLIQICGLLMEYRRRENRPKNTKLTL